MKPIAIFRHSPTEGPGYFATFLDSHRLARRLVRVDAGEPVPADPREFRGLCFMGGPMSVNDPLPWIPEVLKLIRSAVEADIPVIGHCLGGQLISRALGGTVGPNPVKELGWGRVDATSGALARGWLGEIESFVAFHWHGETFTLPSGATRILASPWCENQAFALGKHLGMQCHVEMTEEMIRRWCHDWDREVSGDRPPSVQTPSEMLDALERRLADLHAAADALYERWIRGLA